MKRELRDASSYISKILREGDEYYKETKVSPEYQNSINLESTTLFLHRLVHTQSFTIYLPDSIWTITAVPGHFHQGDPLI